MNKFLDSFILASPYHAGEIVKYREYKNSKIGELIKNYDIKNLRDFASDEKSNVLAKEIIQNLFVKDFLKSILANHADLSLIDERTGEPDFRIEQKGEVILTIEVYAPSFTKRVTDIKPDKNGFIFYNSQHLPLETKTIKNKIGKYRNKYPNAKECLFCFFIGHLNQKNIMRAFYNFYGDTIHSNGALAHNHANPYCIKEEMKNVAGFFFTEGHINIRDSILEYQDVIFAHNPFCDEKYKLPLAFLNSNNIFQSYIQFLNRKPTKGEWWGNFLIRFYQNKYPNYSFLKSDIDYCKQCYPEITIKA